MTYVRTVLLVFMLVIACRGQSPYNSISHGIILHGGEASSLALGGSGLVPVHNSRLSYLNPSTWPDLRFTYLTAHYGAGRVEYPDNDFRSRFGRLENIAFLLPIRGKYALGLGLKPFSRKSFSMEENEESAFVFSSDTLTVTKAIEGSGGISTLYTGASWKIDDTTAIGARIDFLFGAFHEITSSWLDGGPPVIAGRDFQYRGALLSLYYRTLLEELLANATFYAAGQIALGKGDIVLTNQPLYLDRDGDGNHSSSDLPYPGDVTAASSRLPFPLPSTLSLGLAYHLTPQTHVNFEVSASFFQSKPQVELSSIRTGYRVKTGSSLSVGLLRERIPGSRDFFNLFHYRVGFFQRQHYIFGLNGAVTEQGISAGIGIPFGSKLNQVDFGFRLSKRDGFLSEDREYIDQISLGITIGDVWLVKRRRR